MRPPGTRVKRGNQKPIILFGGLNGAGKTSILLGIKLALYGRLAPGIVDAIRIQRISGRLHTQISKSSEQTTSALWNDFHWKTWTFTSLSSTQLAVEGKVTETVRIWDGDEKTRSFQGSAVFEWIDTSWCFRTFFFDGEKIAELAEDKSGKTLKSR